MSEEESETATEVPTADDAVETAAPQETAEPTETASSAPPQAGPDVASRVPEFAELEERIVRRHGAKTEMLHGVRIPIWAELGRAEMVLRDLLQLGEGSVVRLDRSVGDPVDLMAQGVLLAKGEVIVVDDCFAIRIREVVSGD